MIISLIRKKLEQAYDVIKINNLRRKCVNACIHAISHALA